MMMVMIFSCNQRPRTGGRDGFGRGLFGFTKEKLTKSRGKKSVGKARLRSGHVEDSRSRPFDLAITFFPLSAEKKGGGAFAVDPSSEFFPQPFSPFGPMWGLRPVSQQQPRRANQLSVGFQWGLPCLPSGVDWTTEGQLHKVPCAPPIGNNWSPKLSIGKCQCRPRTFVCSFHREPICYLGRSSSSQDKLGSRYAHRILDTSNQRHMIFGLFSHVELQTAVQAAVDKVGPLR